MGWASSPAGLEKSGPLPPPLKCKPQSNNMLVTEENLLMILRRRSSICVVDEVVTICQVIEFDEKTTKFSRCLATLYRTS